MVVLTARDDGCERGPWVQIALFGMGNVNELGLRPEWTSETVILLFGGATLDLTRRPPAPDARLTVVVLFGGVRLLVPAESRLTVGGFSLFGGRSVRAESGTGPDLRIDIFSAFGGAEIKEAPARTTTTRPPVVEDRTFPF